MRTTSLKISQEMLNALKLRCKLYGVGQSTLIRMLIADHLARYDASYCMRQRFVERVMTHMNVVDENKIIITLAERYLNENNVGSEDSVDHQ